MIVDAHNDLLLELVLDPREPNGFATRWLDQLRTGGVRVQVCPIYVAEESQPPDAALAQAAAFAAAVANNEDSVVQIRMRGDLEAVSNDERLGLILSLEGVEALGGAPAAFDEWWQRGVRMASLTWNHTNAFAGGIDDAEQGLTSAGAVLVERMRDLGAIIDLAHASPRTITDVVERVPDAHVCISHTGCRALVDIPRNVDDQQLRAVAERGGVIGLMALVLTVGADQPTLKRFVDHIDHAVSVVGAEHVGLGGDFVDQVVAAELGAGKELEEATKEAMRVGGGRLAIRELSGPSDYPRLVDALRGRGYVDPERDAILGGNWLRLFAQALPAS
jgi:membrane dipeptidase